MPRRRETGTRIEYTGNEIQIVTFRLGKETFGVRVKDIREIVKLENVTRVPQMPIFIEGVMNLRGQITTIVDLKKLMELPRGETDPGYTRIIVAEISDGQLGLIVDSVKEVIRVSPESITDPPKMVSSQKAARFLAGICKLPDQLILLIDISRILSGNQFEQVIKATTASPSKPSEEQTRVRK